MRLWEWLLGRLGGDLLPADLPEVRPEGPSAHDLAVRAVEAAVLAERERCAALARLQPYYPDTHTGTRQQWVKDRIVEAILSGRLP